MCVAHGKQVAGCKARKASAQCPPAMCNRQPHSSTGPRNCDKQQLSSTGPADHIITRPHMCRNCALSRHVTSSVKSSLHQKNQELTQQLYNHRRPCNFHRAAHCQQSSLGQHLRLSSQCVDLDTAISRSFMSPPSHQDRYGVAIKGPLLTLGPKRYRKHTTSFIRRHSLLPRGVSKPNSTVTYRSRLLPAERMND